MSKKRDGLREVAKRGYWREADARALIEAWRSSGETLARFAQRYSVGRSRLTRWLKRLEGTAPMVLHPVRLVADATSASSGDGPIEIQLADGRCVRVPHDFRSDDLRRVLTVLTVLTESLPC